VADWEESLKKKEKKEADSQSSQAAAPTDITKAAESALARCRGSTEEDGGADWRKVCLEICWRVAVSGTSLISGAVSLFQSLELKQEEDSDAIETIADSLWFVSTQVSALPPAARAVGSTLSKVPSQIAAYAKALAVANLVPTSLFQLILPEDVMASAGFYKDANLFNKKIKKLNTDLVYRQQKYNLLREESEGWAKLVVLLADPPSESDDSAVGEMLALVGCFELDPNRVLGLVLDAVGAQLASGTLTATTLPRYLSLIKQFKASGLPHLIGFEIAKQRSEHAGTGQKLDSSSLRLAAMLVACGLLDLKDLAAHLEPGLEEMEKQQAAADKKKAEETKSFGVISLTSKDEKVEEKKDENAAVKAALASDVEGELLQLLEAALDLRLWGLASQLFDCFEVNQIEAASNYGVRRALFGLVDSLIDGMYKQHTSFCLNLANTKNPKPATPTVPGPIESDLGINGSIGKPTDFGGMLKTLEPVVMRLGVHLHKDIRIFTKLCRVLKVIASDVKKHLNSTSEERRLQRILEVVLLPSLSFYTHHCAAAFEVWEAIKNMPFEWRYGIYSSWVGEGLEREATAYKHPDVVLAELRAGRTTRDVMKRLSKENIKQTGRQLAKIAHANPHVLFHAILGQIQSYDNLIQPVVDALKFATPLALDVLSFNLLTHLNSSRDKMKGASLNLSDWLVYLSQFIGVLYRKFPQTELRGLLVLMVNRLEQSHTLDLVVLKELLIRMGGIDMPGEELSDKQVNGMAGGELLRAETISFGIREKVAKRASNQLRDAFFSSGTALPLLVLIAQQRAHALYETDTKHLKIMGWLFDTCEEVLSHLVEFLSHPSKLEEYLAIIPPMSVLVGDYKLSPPLAFMITRPLIREALFKGLAECGQFQKWYPFSDDFQADVKLILPADSWDSLSTTMYITFWTLHLHDVYCPQETYEEEIARLQNAANQIERECEKSSDREEISKKRKEAMKVAASAMQLEEELQTHQNHCNKTHALLLDHKGLFFATIAVELYKAQSEAVLTRCAYPRLVLGAADALYTAKFFHMLHEISVPKFSTLQHYDRIFKDLIPTLFCSTEREAAALGFFLNATLTVLKKWRFDEIAYQMEAQGRPGFSINFLEDEGKRASFTDYSRVFDKWMSRIGRVFISCLKGGQYMHIRCSLLCMTRLVEVFPHRQRLCALLLGEVAPLKTDEHQDLKVMANRYWAMLDKQKSEMLDDTPTPEELKKDKDKKEEDNKASKSKEKEINTKKSGVSQSQQQKSGSAIKENGSLEGDKNKKGSSPAKKLKVEKPAEKDDKKNKKRDRSRSGNREPVKDDKGQQKNIKKPKGGK